ncbi:MAG: PilZ domain-containing protein [Deferrisomatales bacterium]|nr:PilZ domain-containing protein [Deferrisomatales bacterium]
MAAESNDPGQERRAAPRFALALLVEWPGGTGVTTNVSRLGAQWTAETPPALGEVLPLTVRLPGRRANREIAVQCRSEVLRVEPAGAHAAVGVRFTDLRFEGHGPGGGLSGSPTNLSKI